MTALVSFDGSFFDRTRHRTPPPRESPSPSRETGAIVSDDDSTPCNKIYQAKSKLSKKENSAKIWLRDLDRSQEPILNFNTVIEEAFEVQKNCEGSPPRGEPRVRDLVGRSHV